MTPCTSTTENQGHGSGWVERGLVLIGVFSILLLPLVLLGLSYRAGARSSEASTTAALILWFRSRGRRSPRRLAGAASFVAVSALAFLLILFDGQELG